MLTLYRGVAKLKITAHEIAPRCLTCFSLSFLPFPSLPFVLQSIHLLLYQPIQFFPFNFCIFTFIFAKKEKKKEKKKRRKKKSNRIVAPISISINRAVFHSWVDAIRIRLNHSSSSSSSVIACVLLRPRSISKVRVVVSSSMANKKSVLVTGGAGYIGSHTVLQLLLGGFRTVVVDNLDNASQIAVDRVKLLAADFGHNLSFHKVDLRDKPALEKIFSETPFDAVIHFAGLKAVGESVQKPLLYYNNNLIGTITLLEVMAAHGCKKLVFSSSATVYGWPKEVPCTEEFPLAAVNPYGRTKLFIEEICRDIYQSDSEWKIILLRYFNPIGAHPSGYIGEDPRGIPNNLMPFVQQVAVGRRPALTVFGTDYSTKDGTGVRDYIHVVDLADGHIAALQKLDDAKIGCEVYNLGTGKGTSVLEMVAAFEKASGKKIPVVIAGRRHGDAEIVYASTEKAERELNWKARYDIDEMCRDQWNWASKNPYGYESQDSSN